MMYITKENIGKLLLFVLVSIGSQLTLAEPNIRGQISQQVIRTNSQAINKNLSNHMLENEKNKKINTPVYTNGQIREVQELLHDLGYEPGEIEGHMGQQTRKAIRNFQKSHQLKSDGILTDNLFKKLHVASSKK